MKNLSIVGAVFVWAVVSVAHGAVGDRPGVLAHITTCLGNEGISIRNLMQRDAVDGRAQIVLITHDAGECSIRKALAAIDSRDARVESMIRVETKP